MKYRKFDKAMWKFDTEYSVNERNAATYIETAPEKNETARKNIESAIGRKETCVNSSPGRFTIIRTDINTWKA